MAEEKVVHFDVESADANSVYRYPRPGTGGFTPDAPYVKLYGALPDRAQEGGVTDDPEKFLGLLRRADVIVGANVFKFDLVALALHCGADYDELAEKAVDLMRWAQVIDPPGSRHQKPWSTPGYYGLDAIARRLGFDGKTDDLPELARAYGPGHVTGKERERLGYGMIPAGDSRYREYLRGDLTATRRAYQGLMEETPPERMPYVRREMRVAHLQNRMTLSGWRVDEKLLAERVRAEEEARTASLEWLHDNIGLPLTKTVARGRGKNRQEFEEAILSPVGTAAGKQAIIRAFAEAGAEHYPQTASGELATSRDALGDGSYMVGKGAGGRLVPGMLNPRAYGANEQVREICKHVVAVTGATAKFAEVLKHAILQADGTYRVHGGIGMDQASGRWAMTKPSLTNMGKRGPKVSERAVMVADDGFVLICFDLDQVDMRAIAGNCQDPAYMDMFGPGKNAHSMIADQVFGRHDGEWRNKSKRIGHGWNYGMSVKGIANSGVELELAERFDAGMNESFPGLIAWRNTVRAQASAGQLLDNGFGRLMRCDEGRAHTQAPALMGQGGARDIMCEGLLRLPREYIPWLRGVVHDEIVMVCPEDRVDEVSECVQQALTMEFKGVPITCGASRAAWDWASCYAKD